MVGMTRAAPTALYLIPWDILFTLLAYGSVNVVARAVHGKRDAHF